MENLKLLRKAKKKTRQMELQREMQQEATTARCNSSLNYYDINRYLCDIPEPNMCREDYFNKLSDELILHIFKCIPRKILLRYATVCKRWYELMFDESLWHSFDLSYKTVQGEILMKLLNRGVKMLALGHSDIRKSTKKYITHNDNSLRNLPAQLDTYLFNTLKIQYLDLTNSSLEVNSINALLKHCRSLLKLSLESLQIDNQTFFYIGANKKLETLNICSCKGFTIEGVIVLLESIKMLNSLNIAWTYLERESVYLICKHLPPTMEKLSLAGCKTTLLDSDIENLILSCPNLVDLDLSDAQSLTGLSVEMIADNLHRLEYVAFSRCYSILPSSLFTLSKLKNLIAIDVFNILKDKSISTVKSYIPTLLYVNRYPFCFIARPRIGNLRKSLWGNLITQNLNYD